MRVDSIARLVIFPAVVPIVFFGVIVSTAVGTAAVLQEPDVVAEAKSAAAALTEADKQVVAARRALNAAQTRLDPKQFGSASWNARVAKEQEAKAKQTYEQAEESDKQNALELYQLAQELAVQRANELKAAEEALPAKEAEAQAAEEKYAAALAKAEQAAASIKQLVRQSQRDAAEKVSAWKLAAEEAAFAKAKAEETAAINAATLQVFADLATAEANLNQAAEAYHQAAEADRPAKKSEAENAVKAYVQAVHAAIEHLPQYRTDSEKVLMLEVRNALFDADHRLKVATASLERLKNEIQAKTKAIEQAEARVKSAQQAVENRIAKIRAEKNLAREQAALERSVAAKAEAEKRLPEEEAKFASAQQEYATALQNALQAFVLSQEPEPALVAVREAIATAINERKAAIEQQNAALAEAVTKAEQAAEAAKSNSAAADQLLVARKEAWQALDHIQRQRFFRNASSAQNEFRSHEQALVAERNTVQAKSNELNQATQNLQNAKNNLAKVQKDNAPVLEQVAARTKEKQAADQAVNECKTALANADQANQAAQEAVKAAQTALDSAAEEQKADLEAALKEKQAAAQKAAELMKAAEAALKQAQETQAAKTSVMSEAQAKAEQANQAIQAAQQAVNEAQQKVDAANEAKTAAEQAVQQRQQNLAATAIQITEARLAACGGLKLLPPEAWDRDKARHLLVRAGFGGTPDQVDELYAMGLHRAVRHLVDFKSQPPADVPFAAYPPQRPQAYVTALSNDEQRLRQRARVQADRQQMQATRVWWLKRMIEAPRPLEEKLTLFWHGQIPSQYGDVGNSYHMYLQNELFREHAAGNFGALLHGVVHDAAMLKYLNADTNVKGRANENLARELMELFSMGRDQGYTETDIRQGARALTGYTYDPYSGQFRFVSSQHDTEPKTVLGQTGNWNGDDFVKLILDTPYPSKFVARQIFRFFAHDDPSLDTIEGLAGVLRQNDYELEPMLENLFLSEEFYSERAMSTQIKSPVQLIVGLHRDLGLQNADYAYLTGALRLMGQDLFEPPSVFGWQKGRAWIASSRILSRYNVLAEILQHRPRAGKKGVDVVGTLLSGREFKTHDQVVDFLIQQLWRVPVSEQKRQSLIEFIKPLPEPAQWAAEPDGVNQRLTQLIVMLVCSPEFQLT